MIKSRRRWALHVACIGERKGAYTVLVGSPEGKSPLERPRRIWEDNIKVDLQKNRIRDSLHYIYLAHDRDRWRALVKAVMNLRVP